MREAPEVRFYELRETSASKALDSIELLAVPYDTWTNLGYYVERVMPHAPDKSIREAAKGLPLLLFHDNQRFPIGTSASWELTRSDGLVGRWSIDKGDPLAQETARKARDGFLNGASIGFQSIRAERVWNDEDEWDDRIARSESELQVTRTEIRLLEVSLTPTPAYAAAGVRLVRSRERNDRHAGMSDATKRLIAGYRKA